MATMLPLFASAQLRVDSTGKVTLLKALHCKQINATVGSGSWIGNLEGITHGLKVNTSTGWIQYGLPGYINSYYVDETCPIGFQLNTDSYHSGKKNCFGLVSRTVNDYGYDYERSQSVTGIAEGCSTSGQTFGVVGSYEGYGGAGVYGSYGISAPVSDGRYAGYFSGNVKVTGTVNGTVISSSDIRLKQDVRELDGTEDDALGKLDMLSPISYRYDASVMEPNATAEGDGGKVSGEWKNPVYEKTHFGLVAQELREIYPDLVYENDNGYLSINYTELIPVLIQGIKELKAKVEQLSSPTVRKAKIVETETTEIDAAIADVAGMDQNVPNPFSGETDIAIYLPENIQTAILYIYDMSGKQVGQHAIEGRGNTTMTIHADRMDAGMYIYSLIADNKVVATKRMIVVK